MFFRHESEDLDHQNELKNNRLLSKHFNFDCSVPFRATRRLLCHSIAYECLPVPICFPVFRLQKIN